MMRINVILKRDHESTKKIVVGDLIVDEDAHLLTISGQRIDLPNQPNKDIANFQENLTKLKNIL